jgi:signal transduction histidine kinase
MKDTAIRLAEGDYTAKTEVFQQDEIGELAEAVDSLAERLDEASRESEKLDQLRRDFVANISHELRTPVTVIRGSLEAICDDVVTDREQVKQYHQQMLNESLYLQRLVNDLLDLSRLQNTQFQMEQQEVNLCELLRDVVRSAGQLAKKKNIDIQLEMDASLLQMMGDYGRLRQMFFIILDNAIKFSPEKAVVRVICKDQIISIQDYGIGIAKNDLPYLFDRFYQVKSEQNKSGTGLGLAIAKEIADRHQIKVTVSSVQGEGTTVQFYLPSDA